MKKGKIATLAAFCALFAALCLTACGDEGKGNATPLSTNTALQTETAKPTEVPTVEPTAVPTEGPILEKNYMPVKAKKLSKDFCLLDDADANGFEIDEALAYKILQNIYPDENTENFIPHNGKWIPEGTRENNDGNFKYYEFEYIASEDYLYVLSTKHFTSDAIFTENLKYHHYPQKVCTFTYNGELIEMLKDGMSFPQLASEECSFFICNNKLYFAVIAHQDSEPPTNGTCHSHKTLNEETGEKESFDLYLNPFWIYELGKESVKMVWDEFVLSQYDELFNNDLSDKEAVFYEFKDDGVDFYLSEEDSEKRNVEYIYHISFKQLLDDLNSGVTKREEAPELTAEELLEYKMFQAAFPEYKEHIKYDEEWKNPRNNHQSKFLCKFYYMEDCIILDAKETIPYTDKEKFIIARFTKNGDLEHYFYTSSSHKVFVHENNIYLATCKNWPYLTYLGAKYKNYLSIYKVNDNDFELVWDEETFFPNNSMTSDAPLETCHDAYNWYINKQDGVGMCFYNERTEKFEHVKDFTFDELLSGVDITDW
ncbi:MAG: hypothetical protein J6A50_00640 [Clostridia bacterium]|nr:hypothetical protein [Clostridia bacterium]